MHLVGFYYKNTSQCTVLWISNNVLSLELKRHLVMHDCGYQGFEELYFLHRWWYNVLGSGKWIPAYGCRNISTQEDKCERFDTISCLNLQGLWSGMWVAASRVNISAPPFENYMNLHTHQYLKSYVFLRADRALCCSIICTVQCLMQPTYLLFYETNDAKVGLQNV